MTQTVAQVRNVVARSGFANPLTLAVLVADSDYLKVYADEELLVAGPDYEVTGIGDPAGVSIEIIGAEDIDEYVGYETFTALYDPPLDQLADFSLGGGLARPYEVALDQQNRRLQSLGDRTLRAVKMPVFIEGDIVLPPPVDGYMIAWDEDEGELVWLPQAPVGAQGDPGPQGDQGEQGIQGVSVTNAEVVGDDLIITLSEGAPLNAGDVRGPQGDQGDPGPQGEPGLDGEDGTDGIMASVVAGDGITVDSTDPANPIVTVNPKNSIEIDAGELQLDGDSAAPGADKVYGTDGAGVRGWKDDPEGGGGGLFKGNNGEIGTGAGDIFRINAQTLTEDVTIDADENASATGPLAIESGNVLTVASGGTLAIV